MSTCSKQENKFMIMFKCSTEIEQKLFKSVLFFLGLFTINSLGVLHSTYFSMEIKMVEIEVPCLEALFASTEFYLPY